jgi:hypothetical protein
MNIKKGGQTGHQVRNYLLKGNYPFRFADLFRPIY